MLLAGQEVRPGRQSPCDPMARLRSAIAAKFNIYRQLYPFCVLQLVI